MNGRPVQSAFGSCISAVYLEEKQDKKKKVSDCSRSHLMAYGRVQVARVHVSRCHFLPLGAAGAKETAAIEREYFHICILFS